VYDVRVTIETIHHVSICVTDLARARRFYGEVLGLQEVHRPHFDVNGAWYQVGDRQLHLIVHAGTQTLRARHTIEPRDGHFAFRVRTYQETLDHLRAHGIECLALPQNTTPWTQIYVCDPDGNVIELNCDR
jgi:glyoxylase I family protein